MLTLGVRRLWRTGILLKVGRLPSEQRKAHWADPEKRAKRTGFIQHPRVQRNAASAHAAEI